MEQHQYNYNQIGEMILVWPQVESLEDVLSALRNNDRIRLLTCSFNDERWDASQK